MNETLKKITFFGIALLFSLLHTHTQPQQHAIPETETVMVKPHRTRRETSGNRQPRALEHQGRFQGTAFYRTIIDNNLFRPLGWRPPRPREPYRLLGTIIPTTRNTVSPQAILLGTTGNKTHIVTIGEKLNKDTKVADIRPRQVMLEKDGQQRTLNLNTAPWLK